MKLPDWAIAAGIFAAMAASFYLPIVVAVLVTGWLVTDCVRDAREVAEPFEERRAVWPNEAGAFE